MCSRKTFWCCAFAQFKAASPVAMLLMLILPGICFAQTTAPNGRATVAGVLTIHVGDDFEHGKSQYFYDLHDATTKRTLHLDFTGALSRELHTGDIVSATGVLRGSTLQVNGSDLQVQSSVQGTTATSTSTLYPQNTIVMIANYLDSAVSCGTVTSLDQTVFGTSGSTVNVTYEESSYSRMSFQGTTLGPYTISYHSTDSCSAVNPDGTCCGALDTIANLIDSQAQNNGVDLSQYSHKVYVLPPQPTCQYIGFGTEGALVGVQERAWILNNSCSETQVIAHELGHNVGMDHASTPGDEYGDQSDFMGRPGGLVELNAPHRQQINSEPTNIILPSSPPFTQTYTLTPLEATPDPSKLQVLKFWNTIWNDYYYFSYRQPVGIDQILQNYFWFVDGLSIHHFGYDSGSHIFTYYLGALSDGQAWTDAQDQITVTQTGHDANGVNLVVSVGTGAPGVTFVPSSVTFGTTLLGNQALSVQVTLVNSGNSPLTVSGITTTGKDFSAGVSPYTCIPTGSTTATIAAGGNCFTFVNFAPTVGGTETGSLVVTDNASNSPQSIPLQGVGLAPISFAPAMVTFSPLLLGQSSPKATVKITNNSYSTVTITNIYAPKDFTQTNTCGNAIARGITCTMSLVFTPSVVGTETSSIQMTDNAFGSPHLLTVTGTGTSEATAPSKVSFSPQPLQTISATKAITLTNYGTNSIVVSRVQVSGDFSVRTDNCTGATLAPQATCQMNVQFRPTAFGTRTGNLTCYDSAGIPSVSSALTGTGTAPNTRFAFVGSVDDNTIASLAYVAGSGQLRNNGYGSNSFAIGDSVADPFGNFLYVTSGNQGTVTVMRVNSNGTLTTIGSPYSIGGYVVRAAPDPSGRFVYVPIYSSNPGQIIAFSLNRRTGVLTRVTTATLSGAPNAQAAVVEPTGRFLLVASPDGPSGYSSISVFSIDQTTGGLSEISGSPFSTNGSGASSIAVDPSGHLVYMPDGQGNVAQFNLDPSTGALTFVTMYSVGYGAVQMAIAPSGQFAYFLGGGNGYVLEYAINPSTGALTSVGSVVTPVPGNTLALDYSGRFLYVAASTFDTTFSRRQNSLYTFGVNANTGLLTQQRVQNVRGQAGLALAQGVPPTFKPNYAFIADLGTATLTEASIISGGNLTQIGSYSLPHPHDVAVDPYERYVYIANDTTGNVSGYALASTGALTAITNSPFAVGGVTGGIAVDPSGRFLYVGNQGTSQVAIFTIGGGGVLKRVGSSVTLGGIPVALTVDPTGRYLYAIDSNNNLTGFTITPKTGALTQSGTAVTAGSAPVGVVVDPSGQYVYVTSSGGSTGSSSVLLYTIRADGSPSVPAIAATGTGFHGVAVDPSGSFLYVTNGGGSTVLGFSIGSGAALTPLSGSPFGSGANPTSLVVSPSNYLYVADWGSDNITIYGLNSAGVLTPIASSPFALVSGSQPGSVAVGVKLQ